MAKRNKTIEVCVGIGMDQLTPQYVTIEIPQLSKQELQAQQEAAIQALVQAEMQDNTQSIENL